MSNSISSTSPIGQLQQPTSQPTVARHEAKNQQPQQQDTVQLSPQAQQTAKAAQGNVDHDGDNH